MEVLLSVSNTFLKRSSPRKQESSFISTLLVLFDSLTMIEVMKYIRDATNEEKGTYVTKKKIIEAAKERNLKFAIEGDIENDKSLYPRLDSNILEPLLNKGLVEVESVGRSSRVTLTDTGRETVDAFEHLV